MSVALTLYTDFVCPFCFIAETANVPRLLREFELDLDWRGFELHPGTPRGGMSLEEKFGPRALTMRDHIKAFAAGFGITEWEPASRMANTRRALAVAEFARDQQRLEPFRAAVMDAYWRDGKDIEDLDVLRDLALAAGLDGQQAVAAADAEPFQDRIDEIRAESMARGVSGIPTFYVGEIKIIGCQPYELLAEAARKSGARIRV